MEYFITSNQITPFVRYSGFHSSRADFSASPVYASDCRLFYFKKGGCVMKFAESEVLTKSGDIIILPPSCPYVIPDTELYIINFDFLSLDYTLEKSIPVQREIITSPHQLVHITDFPQLDGGIYTNLPSIEHIIEKISLLYSNKSLYFRSEMNSLFTHVLIQIFRHILSSTSESSIDEIIEYINANYDKPLSNLSIGKLFHYHPNYLNKLFVKHTGQSLHRYLINYRVERAQLLLTTTSLSASDIAIKCGFKSLSQFSKTFRAYTGVSPGSFRII